MYEEKPITVKALRDILATLPDDAVIAGGCCQGPDTGHVVNDVTFDDYRDGTLINIPAVELRQARNDGPMFAVLNTDDRDFVSLDRPTAELDDDGA